MWGAIIAAGVSAYASSRDRESQSRDDHQNQIALLERQYELRDKERQAQRQYMKDSYAAYSPYGAGGALDPFAAYRPAQGQAATTGGLLSNAQLAPQNYYQGTRRYY